MSYLACNAESAIATCDPCLSKKPPRKKKKTLNKPFIIREFSYCDIHSSTNGFSQSYFLGKGSHGSVYKAHLENGKLIAAVKKTTYGENEIEVLSRVRNPRLVNLLGFAVDPNDSKLIVVEFMPNGSLYGLLHGSTKPPGWTRRFRFALQVAKAVHFLHSSEPTVIHRDIKSSNVLIDPNWNARLGDFSLALRGHMEDIRVKCTRPAGTLGYLDPGYLTPGDVSTKSDVFSFGILLLEIISGRNAIDVNYSPPSVVDWAVPIIKSGDYSEICDPRIAQPGDEVMIRQLGMLAANCVRSKAEKRPTMAEVVEFLKLASKRGMSPGCNNFGRRVGPVRKSRIVVKSEAFDDSTELIKTSRSGSGKNRKVSSVTSVELMSAGELADRVCRSKSIGSASEVKHSAFNLINNEGISLGRRKAGLAVKMPTVVRLRKSKSMSVLQSTRLVNNTKISLQLAGNLNVTELKSKLLADISR